MTAYDDARASTTETLAAIARAESEHLAVVQQADALTADLAATQTVVEEQAQTIVTQAARIAELEALLTPPPDPALEAFGVVVPWQMPDYADVPAVFDLLVDLGVKTIRGRWRAGGKGDQVMSLCAEHGIQWLATFIPESWCETGAPSLAKTLTTLEANLRAALAHPDASAVLVGIENANEPNHVRGGGSPLPDWPQRCAAWANKMQAVRDELGHTVIAILSPAMHDVADDTVNGAHWQAMADQDFYYDAISLHAYPKGREATNLLAERLGRVNAAFPEQPPVWLTEFGWMTNPNVNGPAYTEPNQASAYMAAAPWALYGFNGGQVARAFYYELIGNDRGLYRNGAWEPAGLCLQGMLTA